MLLLIQGDSEKLVLRAFTLKNAARQVDPSAKIGNKRMHSGGVPFFWIVLSIASVLVVISIVLGLVIRTRCFTGGRRGSREAGIVNGGRPTTVTSEAAAGKSRKGSATMRFPRHEMEISRTRNGSSGEEYIMMMMIKGEQFKRNFRPGQFLKLFPVWAEQEGNIKIYIRGGSVSSPADGIHQIVGRFLEQFRYMCPLLFSCVFPS
jgi:hypothetical protein